MCSSQGQFLLGIKKAVWQILSSLLAFVLVVKLQTTARKKEVRSFSLYGALKGTTEVTVEIDRSKGKRTN